MSTQTSREKNMDFAGTPGNASERRGRTTQLPSDAELVTPSDESVDDFPNPVAIQVLSAGTIQLLPFSPRRTTPIPITIPEEWLPYEPNFMIRRVVDTGTTADMVIVGAAE